MIAFVSRRDGNEEVYVMGVDGGNQTRLTFADAADTDPSWSPDGSQIVFSSTREGGYFEIYVMDADGSNSIRLTTADNMPEYSPQWSPFLSKVQPEPSTKPIPETPLSEVGPWVLIRGEEGLWAANPDGSGLSYIYEVEPEQLSIGGRHAAFIEETAGYYGSGLTLKMFSLPGGEVDTITELLSESTEPNSEGITTVVGRIAINQALLTDNLEWSPDGTRLAFTSAHEGPSSDLYVYSPEDGSMTRLSEGPSQAFRPVWSPDGKYIILMGANSFGTGAGYDMAGVWVVCADGSCIRTLFEPGGGDELVLGWISEDTLLLYSFSARLGYYNLRSINIETGEANIFWDHAFEKALLDPESGKILVVVPDFIAKYDPEIEAGYYLVQVNGEAEFVHLWDYFLDKIPANVSWHEEGSVFLVKMSRKIVSLSPEGEVELIVPRFIWNPKPLSSPVEDLWIWLDDGTLILSRPETHIQVLFPCDSHPLWGPDGSTVLFVYEGQLTVGWLDDLSISAAGNGLIGSLRWMGP
jgi:WD40 repeat protein